jgi:hypothetical protein
MAMLTGLVFPYVCITYYNISVEGNAVGSFQETQREFLLTEPETIYTCLGECSK